MWNSANLFSNDELVSNGVPSDLKSDEHEVICISFIQNWTKISCQSEIRLLQNAYITSKHLVRASFLCFLHLESMLSCVVDIFMFIPFSRGS